MRALVTGATGFVGGHLVDVLLRQGDEVTALVRSPAKGAPLAARGVRLIGGDLDDGNALAQAVRDQDIVYHVAGLTAARNEAEFLRVNRDGTGRLLAAAAAAGVGRFVLVSSQAAGGPSERGHPSQGTEAPSPVTSYGRSKLAGEQVVRAGAIPWTIVRPPTVYGPADRELLRAFRAAALGIAPVFGTGDQQLSVVFGPDLAEALAAAGASPRAAGGIFYAAHPETLTSRELVAAIGRAVGKPVRILSVPRWVAVGALAITETAARVANRPTLLTRDKANEFYQPAWTCDPTPLAEATGWRARHDLDAGIAATAAWYRAAGWLG